MHFAGRLSGWHGLVHVCTAGVMPPERICCCQPALLEASAFNDVHGCVVFVLWSRAVTQRCRNAQLMSILICCNHYSIGKITECAVCCEHVIRLFHIHQHAPEFQAKHPVQAVSHPTMSTSVLGTKDVGPVSRPSNLSPQFSPHSTHSDVPPQRT